MSDQLAIVFDVAAASDSALADELCDATLLLDMGEAGIDPAVAAGLRRRRLEACRELLTRWEPES